MIESLHYLSTVTEVHRYARNRCVRSGCVRSALVFRMPSRTVRGSAGQRQLGHWSWWKHSWRTESRVLRRVPVGLKRATGAVWPLVSKKKRRSFLDWHVRVWHEVIVSIKSLVAWFKTLSHSNQFASRSGTCSL